VSIVACSSEAKERNFGDTSDLHLFLFKNDNKEFVMTKKTGILGRMKIGLLLTVCAFVAMATGQASAADTIKIGLLLELTGTFADSGRQIGNAVKTYMAQHGDTVAGKKIELVIKDTTGPAPDIAKRLCQELVVKDNVDFIAGF